MVFPFLNLTSLNITLSSSSPLGRPRPTRTCATVGGIGRFRPVNAESSRFHVLARSSRPLGSAATLLHFNLRTRPTTSPPHPAQRRTIVKLDYCRRIQIEAFDLPSPSLLLQPLRLPEYKPPLLDKESRLLLPHPYRSRLTIIILWNTST